MEKRFHSIKRAPITLVAGAWFLCILMSPFAGTAFAQSVKLSWNPSSAGSISGYNVYRTEVSGAYGSTPVNGLQLVTESSFIDLTVQYNRTYYYAVSTVNGKGVEGSLSAEIQVVVQPPGNTTPGSASLPAPTQMIERVPSDPDVSWGVFPWFVAGGGGIWKSNVMDGFEMALVVQNKSDAEAWFRVEMFDANGDPLAVNGRSISSEVWEQAADGTYGLAASGVEERLYAVSSADVTTGMMTFQTSRASDGTPDVEPFLVYRVKKGGKLLGETFVELGFPETCSRYFAQRRFGFEGEVLESAIAIANLNAVWADVTLTLRDQAGTAVERQTRSIPPGGNVGEMLTGIFQNADSKGSLEVASDVGLVTAAFNLFVRASGDYTFLTIPRSGCGE